MYIHVPVLILFFNITIYGPKHHILACVQPAWEQIEATFGSKFWPVYLANSGLRSKITVLLPGKSAIRGAIRQPIDRR